MKIGDYVNVALVGGINGESRQGVYVSDNEDGTIQVRGGGDVYRCSKKRGIVVPDSYLFDATLEFVQEVRRQLETPEDIAQAYLDRYHAEEDGHV